MNIGYNSEGIRNVLQNRMVHDNFFRNGHGQMYARVLKTNRGPRFVFQFGDF